MKKLLIVAATIVTAGMLNAATVSWASGAIKTPTSKDGGWSTTSVVSGDVASYLFLLTSEQYASYGANASAIYSDFKDGKITADKSITTGVASTLKTDNVYTSGDTVYAAILYIDSNVASYEGVDEFYMATTSTWTFPSSSNKSFTNVAGGIGNWTAVGGGSVPEPTSGLLILVGLAGLALRRRRA